MVPRGWVEGRGRPGEPAARGRLGIVCLPGLDRRECIREESGPDRVGSGPARGRSTGPCPGLEPDRPAERTHFRRPLGREGVGPRESRLSEFCDAKACRVMVFEKWTGSLGNRSNGPGRNEPIFEDGTNPLSATERSHLGRRNEAISGGTTRSQGSYIRKATAAVDRPRPRSSAIRPSPAVISSEAEPRSSGSRSPRPRTGRGSCPRSGSTGSRR